jgi:2-keto-4-pentenoate hydratase/2-oxohepta-3-ene-1,7-dioic acid hydratase in catechol pathway
MSKRYSRIEKSPGAKVYVELADGRASILDGAPWLGGAPTGERIEGFADTGIGSRPLVCPVDPRKIMCVGRNYRAHAKELGNEVPVEPMIFYKPPTSLIGPGAEIELPPTRIASKIEHEAELAVVVGQRLSRASEEEARAAIFGLTVACDVTARDLQKKDGQWWRAKGMDTFCPVGPVIVTALDPQALTITCKVNDEVRQQGSTADMIFSVARVLAHISDVITLEPGDLVLTGTPEGVGPLVAGDRLSIEISSIGTLNVLVSAPRAEP